MSEKDINVLKTLLGTLYKADDYLREEMSEHIIFDKGKEDEPIYHNILQELRELEKNLAKLIGKYGKKKEEE